MSKISFKKVEEIKKYLTRETNIKAEDKVEKFCDYVELDAEFRKILDQKRFNVRSCNVAQQVDDLENQSIGLNFHQSADFDNELEIDGNGFSINSSQVMKESSAHTLGSNSDFYGSSGHADSDSSSSTYEADDEVCIRDFFPKHRVHCVVYSDF